MTQAPIGSGYDEHTTADEVLAGIDLSGRLALVTGGYSGIGIETTRALAAAGAAVVVPARRRETAEEAVVGIDGVEVDELDLADQDSVRAFAERLLATGRQLDIVIDSAGIMAIPETRTPAGWETAARHQPPRALRPGQPALAGAEPAAPASSASPRAGTTAPGCGGTTRGSTATTTRSTSAYGQSKTANVLFAVHLDRLAREHGVRAFALHPGRIITPLMRYQDQQEFVDAGIIDADGNPIDPDLEVTGAGRGHPGVGGDQPAAGRPRRALPRGLRGRGPRARGRADRRQGLGDRPGAGGPAVGVVGRADRRGRLRLTPSPRPP